MYSALLTLAWFVGTIYTTIPLFALIVRPFANFLRARHSRLLVIIPSWFGMMAVAYSLTWHGARPFCTARRPRGWRRFSPSLRPSSSTLTRACTSFTSKSLGAGDCGPVKNGGLSLAAFA